MGFNRPRWARIENEVERKILGEQTRVTLKAGFPWKSVQGSMGYYPIIGAGRNSDAQWPRIFRADDTPCTLCKSFLCSLLARAFIERLSFVERTGTWTKLWLSKIHERFFPPILFPYHREGSFGTKRATSNSIIVKVTLFFLQFLFCSFPLRPAFY